MEARAMSRGEDYSIRCQATISPSLSVSLTLNPNLSVFSLGECIFSARNGLGLVASAAETALSRSG